MPHWIVLSDTAIDTSKDRTTTLCTASGRAALRWIENTSLPVAGVLLSPDSWDEDLSTLLQRCRQLRPGTPVHLLVDEDETDPLHPALNASTRVQLGLSEPVALAKLEEFLDANAVTAPSGAPGRTGLLPEGSFVGVPITDFESCRGLLFDLHLKMPDGRFLRLLAAGEQNPWERLAKYRERGVTHLYVSREGLERNLIAIRLFRDAITARSGRSSGAWSEIQAAHSIREISRLMARLTSLDQLDLPFWTESRELIAQFGSALELDGPLPRAEQSRRWIRRSLFLDRSLSTFTLAALIGRPLHFLREDNFLNLGMAALYHDISLLDFGRDIPSPDDAAGLTGKAREEYLLHPIRSARHLGTELRAGPIVLQAVLFHHWRRDGSGLQIPGVPNPASVPRLAEVIGLAADCAEYLIRNPLVDPQELPVRRLPQLEGKFSSEVLDALRSSLIHPRA